MEHVADESMTTNQAPAEVSHSNLADKNHVCCVKSSIKVKGISQHVYIELISVPVSS